MSAHILLGKGNGKNSEIRMFLNAPNSSVSLFSIISMNVLMLRSGVVYMRDSYKYKDEFHLLQILLGLIQKNCCSN